MFVIALGALFAFLVLALEGGQLYLDRRAAQRAADMAALAAAWAYYQGDYAPASYPGTPDLADPRARAQQVVAANGFAAGDITSVDYVDASGGSVDVSGCPGAGCPAPWQIRGVRVSLTHDVALQLGRALGVASAAVSATATAVIGPSTGALYEGPLLLDGTALPRASTGCTPAGDRYPATPDCRPTLGPVTLFAAYQQGAALQALIATMPAPFAGARRVSFDIVHDPPACATGDPGAGTYSPCDSTPATVRYGEGTGDGQAAGADLLTTCPPAGCPAAPPYYVELGRHGPPYLGSDADGVAVGVNSRLGAAAPPAWAAQRCDGSGTAPLTTDNPRLMRLPISYAAPAPAGANVGAVQDNETLVFCAATLAEDATTGYYAIGGYVVNEPTRDATVLSRADPYVGRDVVIRLSS